MTAHSYLITLSNDEGEIQKIIVQTTCTHDMQAFVDGLTDLKIKNPVVIHIDDRAARHVPIKEKS
jgi:hypothetical protein